MACKIMIFGKRFACPQGLRVSPGANSHANCVGSALAGKSFSNRASVKKAFTEASKAC